MLSRGGKDATASGAASPETGTGLSASADRATVTRRMTPHFVARQLSHPRGLLGRFIVRLMNRHNAKMNAFALERLAPAPTDRVLEIGFGGGLTLPALLQKAAFVAGVDRSEFVVRRGRARFAEEIRGGRADFRLGDVESLPFQPATFDRVCTVNTVYFWRSLDAGFAEIRRIMKPGARLVVGFASKEKLESMGVPRDVFTPRSSQELIDAVARAGFADVKVEHPRPESPWGALIATA